MNTAVFQLMPLTRCLSVTSYIHSQILFAGGPELPGICSVSHLCLTSERSSSDLILQAAMLAVSATTHICVARTLSATALPDGSGVLRGPWNGRPTSGNCCIREMIFRR